MDEHGPDVPETSVDRIVATEDFISEAQRIKENFVSPQRKYLPTLADLIDRLTIVVLKQINIPQNREAYDNERNAILHDIRVLWRSANFTIPANAVDVIEATIVVMLANKTIWDNESLARQGSDKQNDLLRFTHSINGVRNRAKNVIAKAAGERLDLKVDALAADLPKDLGAWNII